MKDDEGRHVSSAERSSSPARRRRVAMNSQRTNVPPGQVQRHGYARHGRELMECKSPVRERTSTERQYTNRDLEKPSTRCNGPPTFTILLLELRFPAEAMTHRQNRQALSESRDQWRHDLASILALLQLHARDLLSWTDFRAFPCAKNLNLCRFPRTGLHQFETP
jgi:hypothetical protein